MFIKTNLTIKRLSSLQEDYLKDFSSIAKEDPTYESYDDSFPIYIAYLKKEPIAFLTYLITDDSILPASPTVSASKKENSYKAEVRAFVREKYRNHGVFKELIKALYEDLGDIPIVYELPSCLKESSLASNKAFSELLLSLSKSYHSIFADNHLNEKRYKYNCSTNLNIIFEENADELIVIAKEKNSPLACLAISFSSSYSFLHSLYVDEKARGLGIGTKILKEALDYYFDKSDANLLIHVQSSNIIALKLYESFNFKEIEQIDFFAFK